MPSCCFVKLRFWIKWLQALLGAAAAAILTLAQLALPSQAYWQDHKELLFWGVITPIAVAAILVPLGEAIDTSWGTRRPAVHLACLRQLVATLHLILEKERLAYDQVGLHVFLVGVGRVGWKPQRIQRRVARLRLAGAPDDEGMIFTKGKGVVGACWANGAPARGDWSQVWARHKEKTETQWSALPPDETQGFTYGEFRLTGPEYGAIVAYPIITKDKYRGCVAIDGPPGRMDLLWNSSVRGRLQICAENIGSLLNARQEL
jgi:hypothetical protein